MAKTSSKRRFWTEAERELLRRDYATTLTRDLAQALGRPVGTVHQHAAKLGLRKTTEFVSQLARERSTKPGHGSQKTRFRKGLVPWNTGTHYVAGGRSAETRFKPGHKPPTWLPVGSFRIVEGILEQKYADDPGPPGKRWKAYARIVWERAHGEITPGMSVVFKPGHNTTDPERITPDVLELLTRAELMQRNTFHNWPKPIARLVQLRGVLKRQINRKTKEAEEA